MKKLLLHAILCTTIPLMAMDNTPQQETEHQEESKVPSFFCKLCTKEIKGSGEVFHSIFTHKICIVCNLELTPATNSRYHFLSCSKQGAKKQLVQQLFGKHNK